MEILNEMKIKINDQDTKYKGFFTKIKDNEHLALVHIRTIEDLTGYKVEYIDNENLNINIDDDILEMPLDLIVAIDEGHGGKDAGAVDEVNETEGDFIRTLEKDLNNKVGNKVINKLRTLGAEVIVTRPDDTTVSLGERVRIANNAKVDLFVSIHFNAGSSLANGIETFKYRNTKNPISHALAENVHKELIDNTGFKDRGVKTSGFYVIKNTNMPAILVELGFITNTKEEKIVNTDEFQEKCANAIVAGILKTVSN